MKKYLMAVAAFGLLAACSGKQTQVPVEVEEETVTVAEIPIQAAPPVMPVMKEKPAKPINMRDSLKADPKKGAVIQKKFKASVPAVTKVATPATATAPATPAVNTPALVYDMTIYFQENGEDGVYEFDEVIMDAASPKTMVSTGKHRKHKGTPANAEAVVYEFIPSDGSPVFYFMAEGNNLMLLNQDLQQATSDLNYTLQLVP